jgi:hypothetical protein
MWKRLLILSAGFLLSGCGFLLAGCGHDSGPKESESDGFQQALAYAQCIRANGVPTFPDPQRDGNRITVSGGQELNTPQGKKAAEACRDKEPQHDTNAGGSNVDPDKLTAWMKCMRAQLPKWPDAQVNNGTITIQLRGTGLKGDSPEFENARKACESKYPGGNLHVEEQP